MVVHRRPSKIYAVVVMALFAVVGTAVLLVTHAAVTSPIATLEAEALTLPSGTTTISDSAASGTQAIKFSTNGEATGSVSLPSTADTFTVRAKGDQCKGAPTMIVTLDGIQVGSTTSVTATAWTDYSFTKSLPAGSHNISLAFNNDNKKGCSRNLYVDKLTFNGTVVNPPVITFSASPTSVTADSSSTLTWSGTNATSCNASGAWTGTQPVSGSTNTGAINVTSTYTLSCSGAGGAASESVTVSVANTASLLPKQGISTGYKILTRTATDRQFELDKIQRVFNGHAGFVRIDSTPTNQTQLDAVMNDVLSRGLTPMLILYGTTGPRSTDADTFGYDQAVKWAGKVTFFEVGNEPDINGWTPDGYADFAKAVAQSVKSGNPNAKVIAGALWKGTNTPYTPQDYVRSLSTLAKGSFDYVSLHLYDDPKSRASWNIWDMAFPVLFGTNSVYKGNTCREILDANGLSSVPIISTESGGPVSTYGESGQNTIVGNDFDALNSNLLPSLAIYSMKNDDVAGFGLLRDDNTERPAYGTFMSRAYD